jgi:hypothetical protein
MENLAKNIFNEILNNKIGNTFHIDGNIFSPKIGYFVGTIGFSVPKIYFMNPKWPINTLLFCMEENLDLSKKLVGYWIEKDIIFIDSVEYFENLSEAIETAKKYKQLAIYDIKNSNSIYL